ncbi:MAG: surface-adhesin E family protein [Burkholderiales bacterium]
MMRKVLAVALVCLANLLAPATAYAEWQLVSAEDGIFRAYADPDTIRRAGSGVRMHGLLDFVRGDFTPDGRALFSTRVYREYDCVARRVRLLAYVDLAGRMGEGEAVAMSDKPGRWEAVSESSLDERYLSLACAAR